MKEKLLGYYSTTCTYCKQTIYLPKYRLQPKTYEEAKIEERRLAKELMAKLPL